MFLSNNISFNPKKPRENEGENGVLRKGKDGTIFPRVPGVVYVDRSETEGSEVLTFDLLKKTNVY